VIELGKKVEGRLLEIPQEVALSLESTKGKIYQLRIETEGFTNENEVVNTLISGLENFGAKVLWIRACSPTVEVQVEGSPFAWSAVLPWISPAMSLIGVVVILIALYSVIAAIPSWAWGLLVLGIGLLFFSPYVGEVLGQGKT